MRRAVSLLMVGFMLVLAGCAKTGESRQDPSPPAKAAEPAPVAAGEPGPTAPGPPTLPLPSPAATAPPTPPETGGPALLPPPVAPKEERWLYPAYAFVDGGRKWGYIDPTGNFAIPPVYDQAAEFEADGLAIVRQGHRSGLVNRDGVQVVAPVWDWIQPANDDLVRVLVRDAKGQVVDRTGHLLFDAPSVSTNFRGGLAPYRDEAGLYGYLNRMGKVVIPAQFRSARDFHNGKAIVEVGDHRHAVIDVAGKRLGEFDASGVDALSEDLIAFQDRTSGLWGYVSVSGQVVIPARYGGAWPFKDGVAVVSVQEPWARPRQVGLINARGEFVIPAEYEAVQPLGNGLYAVAQPTEIETPDQFLPKALLTADGQPLTEFAYYNPQPVAQGLISVSDGRETFFLDTQGRRVAGLPSVPGFGALGLAGSLIKADVDDRVQYLDRSGRVVWQGDNTIILAGGLRVIERKYRPDMATLIFYPEFDGLADTQAQEALNQGFRPVRERKSSGGGEAVHSTMNSGFSVRQIKDLVILYQTSYWYGWGAAHGMPNRTYVHVDAKSGTIYRLADLFKKESRFTDRLQEIVRQQIATREDRPMQENPTVSPNHAFYVSGDALTIYYWPYEIASYAQGFIAFTIPWSELSDLIDTTGLFWKAFH